MVKRLILSDDWSAYDKAFSLYASNQAAYSDMYNFLIETVLFIYFYILFIERDGMRASPVHRRHFTSATHCRDGICSVPEIVVLGSIDLQVSISCS